MTTSVLVVRALYDFNSNDSSSLSFKRDDIIQVLTQLESGWWDGLCNGERGWFPSNYVTAYEEDDLLDDEEKLSDWIPQQTPDGEIFYYNTRTQESAWDLPIDDNDSESISTNIRDTMSSNRSLRELPENWIQRPTEDGNTYYYFNVETKEIRWTYPGSGATISDNFDVDEEKDDERIDSHVTSALVEVNQQDLENNEIADKASIASSQSSQLSSTTVDTIRQRSQQRNSIENLPPNWGQKTTPQGRVYYYNKLTDETTWSLDNIDAEGHLIRVENGNIPNGNESGDEVQHEPSSPTSLNQLDQPRKFSESSLFMLQNSNELTWDSLSQSIGIAIQNLNLAASENLKQNYTNCTNDIVESIRIMLYASGTVEKDSPAIRQDRNLKNYHRHIMASLSKLVLSTKVASGVWPPPDSAQKMRNDADEVLMAVRQFVQAAEQTVNIKRVDPKLLESATGGSWRGNNLLSTQTNGNKITNGRVPKPPSISSSVNSQDNNSAPNSPTNFTNLRPLTLDLIASLDQMSRTVNQAIQLLLNHIKKVIDTPSNLSINVSFFPQLISQTKQVVTQVGQFLPLIEEINLEELDESSLGTINEFNIVKQALYNNIAKLVIFAQSATDPLASLNALDQVLVSTNMVDKAIKDVVIAAKFLVEEKAEQEQNKLRPRRPSVVETPPTKRRITSSYSTNSTSSNNNNALDQIVENDSSDSTENQPNPISPVSSSATTGLQTVPENDIISTNGSTLIGDVSPDEYDAQVSPTSANSANGRPTGNRARSDSTVSSKTYNDTASSLTHPPLQRSQTQPILSSSVSADYQFSPSPSPTGGNSGGTKSPRTENKVTKFFGEDVPSNLTQPNKQKEDKPWFLNYDYEPSEMIFNMESYVKGGTLNALVERLTMHDLLDSNFIATFLLTYRSFCTTDEFFDMLVKRFMIQPPENITPEELEVWQEKKQTPVRLRVFNIMKTWLETYYIDGQDSHCLERMREFATTTMHENMAFAAVSLIKVIEKRQQQPKDAVFKALVLTNSDRPPVPILPKNIKKLKFLDIDPLEISRQLTLIECKLYNKIQPVECLDKAWSKEEGGDIAANIKAMIVNSNQITGWVAESVLNQSEVKKRCLYIKHFVAVADKCRALNNFNSLTAIISGLNSAPIHRLKRTWEMVNTKTIQTLEALNKIMNSTKNFAEYRETLHTVNPPCVPFLGVYLTDLTFIEDGNPNTLKKSRQLVNFSKRMKTAEVIREIQQYQSVPYNLAAVQEIQMFIKCHLQDSRDVGDLYDQSLSMEPREREDEKIARLLQESGFL
ncbi:unnamed protein product [Rhizophagus irregularis]|uniref:Ras GEF n=1 Tax=Rhizophagus irregularis TaxID=588596 RepID=A0A2N1MKA4_9GLOM|nr:ras GEF [Rhizophagus irregularis]CAB4380587.1 unnamed protein product [Rhizophagus irregularis]CAB5373327.1 unnamed protein product [Rhizophagus irregularis]